MNTTHVRIPPILHKYTLPPLSEGGVASSLPCSFLFISIGWYVAWNKDYMSIANVGFLPCGWIVDSVGCFFFAINNYAPSHSSSPTDSPIFVKSILGSQSGSQLLVAQQSASTGSSGTRNASGLRLRA